MKRLGVTVLFVGVAWGVYALNIDVTVTTKGEFVGSIYLPPQTVNNIGLMDERRNHLAIAGFLSLAGLLMALLGSKGSSQTSFMPVSSSSEQRVCPFCAESVKEEAIVCKHCKRDLPERIQGLRINLVEEGEALKRGLQVGDVLYSFAGEGLESIEALNMVIRKYEGEEKTAVVIRGHSTISTPLEAGPLGINITEIVVDKPTDY